MWGPREGQSHTLPTRIATNTGDDSTHVLSGELEIRASGRYGQVLETHVWPGTLDQHVNRYYDGPWQPVGDHELTLSIFPAPVTATISADVTVITFTLAGDLYSYRKR